MMTSTDDISGYSVAWFSLVYPGEFPNRFEVYFKDQNYTPDKDGNPGG
jgi:hypothetical protein